MSNPLKGHTIHSLLSIVEYWLNITTNACISISPPVDVEFITEKSAIDAINGSQNIGVLLKKLLILY